MLSLQNICTNKSQLLWLPENWIKFMDNPHSPGRLLTTLPKISSDSTDSSILVQAVNKIAPMRPEPKMLNPYRSAFFKPLIKVIPLKWNLH